MKQYHEYLPSALALTGSATCSLCILYSPGTLHIPLARRRPNRLLQRGVSLFEFSDRDNAAYQSPSLSATTSKTPFYRPTTMSTPTSLISTNQLISNPSHQDDLCKQRTGVVPDALLNTVVVGQNSSQITDCIICSLDYPAFGNSNDRFESNNNTLPQLLGNSVNMKMEFTSPNSEYTANPNSGGGQELSSISSTPVLSRHAGHSKRPRLRQQDALRKDQAQQRQGQQDIQQQQAQHQRQAAQNQQRQQQRAARDPLLEQTITQLLNSMRAKPATLEGPGPGNNYEGMNKRKEIASEEDRKLSIERRRLRNKVSARAFRSRRKECILQMESEIANKVTENGVLRTENCAFVEENRRLTELTRMLLSSPLFPDFLDRLDFNPSQLPPYQLAPQPEEQEARKAPSDATPYAAQHPHTPSDAPPSDSETREKRHGGHGR